MGLRDETQGLVEITDGLAEGDQVVVGNVGILGKGMSVRMAGQAARQGRRRQGRRAGGVARQ